MKVIQDKIVIGSDVYTRTVGINMTLLDVLEHLEGDEYAEFIDDESTTYTVPQNVEYRITVGGKEVDAKAVKIELYDTAENKDEYFYCDETGGWRPEDDLKDLQDRVKELSKLTKEQLISTVLSKEEYDR